jgi:hypothetical protein
VGRKRNKDGEPQLTALEKKFVKEVARTGNASLAISNLKPDIKSPTANAAAMMSRDIVRTALDRELERIYPTHAEDGALILKQAAEMAMSTDKMKEKLEFLKVLAMLKGYQAPREVNTKKLTGNVKDLLKMPWERNK